MSPEYIQMLAALAGILVVVLLLGYLARRKQVKTELMNMVGYHSFGPRKGIAALKVGKEILVLGVTMTDIKLLASYKASDLDDTGMHALHERISNLKTLKENIIESK